MQVKRRGELQFLGNEEFFEHPLRIAIVGARNASVKARNTADMLACEIINAGGIVVTGLARGIDMSAAYAEPGKVIGVLPCGLGQIYPPSADALAAHIIDRGGLLVSKYSFMEKPRKEYFLERNDLIVDLCHYLIAIECRKNSGTAYTVRKALEADKLLMVLNDGLDSFAFERYLL